MNARLARRRAQASAKQGGWHIGQRAGKWYVHRYGVVKAEGLTKAEAVEIARQGREADRARAQPTRMHQ